MPYSPDPCSQLAITTKLNRLSLSQLRALVDFRYGAAKPLEAARLLAIPRKAALVAELTQAELGV